VNSDDMKQAMVQNDMMRQSMEPMVFDDENLKYQADLITVKGIPPWMREKLFALVNEVNQLTNLSRNDVRRVEGNVSYIIDVFRETIPPWELTEELELELEELQMSAFMMIKRSEQGFERKTQATQIQVRSVDYNMPEQQQKTGLTGKLSRAFGMGGRRQ